MEDENNELKIHNDSYIDICQLKKVFDVSSFASSLLPSTEDFENESSDADFLNDPGEKLENDDKLSVKNDDLFPIKNTKTGCVWSNVKFKKKEVPELSEERNEYSEKEDRVQEMDISRVFRKEEWTQYKSNILFKFLNGDRKSELSFYKDKIEDTDIPLIENGDRKFFRFFYLDAYERLYGDEATVYLFGKTYCHSSKCYKSCCVAVCPLNRKLYVQPRQYDGDEYPTKMLKELYNLALKPMNITNFSYRIIRKNILDDLFASSNQIMLEIEYPASYPPINHRLEGKTFTKIFGINNNCFENFILEKNIKGPCWLDVWNPHIPSKAKTWCAFEISCKSQEISVCEYLSTSESPSLTLLSLHVRSVFKYKKIVLLSWAIYSNYDMWNENSDTVEEQSFFAFVSPGQIQLPDSLKFLKATKVLSMKSEEEILRYFLRQFHQIDPDIVITYDIYNEDFHKFLDRLVSLDIEDRSKLSRFKSNTNLKKYFYSGRLYCDLKHVTKEFSIWKNHELDDLYEKFLGVTKEERWVVDLEDFISPSGSLCNLFENEDKFTEVFVLSVNESLYLLKLVSKINVIPLAVKLTEICGNILHQTLTGGITKQSEYLLLHTFHKANFIPPPKVFKKNSNHTEDEELLIGGLVLEPRLGLYENYILLMDFQSLYPSIIYEYNLCMSLSENRSMPKGVLPNLMKLLIDKRQHIKDRMKYYDKKSKTYLRHEIYQTALKLSANSIYGCLACNTFRFYSPSIAKEITKLAREALRRTANMLESKRFEIIYGDTDSIMINTKSKDLLLVKNMGQAIKEMVNSSYDLLNLKIDGIFRKLLLIAKKKYAGICVDENGETDNTLILKGVDIVRYDWPKYVCQVGKIIINIILGDNCLPEKCVLIQDQLKLIKKNLMNNNIPIDSLIITKYLLQDPKTYSGQTTHPHIQVALRCIENSSINFKRGDGVSFVMCTDRKRFQRKAFHPVELNDMKDWKIDGSYYYEKHVHPFVSKICSTIGLQEFDKEMYKTSKNFVERNVKTEGIYMEFARREPFIIKCLKCRQSVTMEENENLMVNYSCQNKECGFSPFDHPIYVENTLIIAVNGYLKKYFRYELKCSTKKCSYVTLHLPKASKKGEFACPVCFEGIICQVFNEMDLFLQLQYFQHIFLCGLLNTKDEKIQHTFKSLLKILKGYFEGSAFTTVNLTELFKIF